MAIKFYWSANQIAKDAENSAQQAKDNRIASNNDFSSYQGKLDDDLYNLLIQNPYKDLYYDYSFWDNIGLSSKAKDANMQYHQLYNEYIANILAQQTERDYNNPINQARLQRLSGVNPDITGISDIGMTDIPETQGAIPTSLNGVSPAIESLKTMGGVLSFALNAYQGISSTLNMIDAQDIHNVDGLYNAARPFVTQSFAEALSNGLDLHTAVASGSNSFAKQYNKRNQKRALKAFENLFYSSDFTLQRNALQNMAQLDDESIKYDARKLFHQSYNNDKTISKFLKLMVDEGVELYKLSRSGKISDAKYNKALKDFRNSSISRLRKNYEDSNGHDILSGLLLIGLMESNSVNLLNDPKAFLMGAGDKVSKDISNGIHKGIDSLKNLF